MDKYVVIEHGATGLPRVYGPFSTKEDAQEAVDNWQFSRWTTGVEVGHLGHPENAAYGTMPGRTWGGMTLPAQINKTYRNRHTGEEHTVLKREWIGAEGTPMCGDPGTLCSGYVVVTDQPNPADPDSYFRMEEHTFLIHYVLDD